MTDIRSQIGINPDLNPESLSVDISALVDFVCCLNTRFVLHSKYEHCVVCTTEDTTSRLHFLVL